MKGARPEAFSRTRAHRRVFRAMLANRKKSWVFNSRRCSGILDGKRDYPCTPWACRRSTCSLAEALLLLQDGYADTFEG